MRAWPSNYRGLRLQIPSGWYPLPAHTSTAERARLIELITAGVEGIDAVVELDWDSLDDDANKLTLSSALVLVALPAHMSDGDELVELLRTKLGSVRLGIFQYAAGRDWPELAWQERRVKVPLLVWMKRWLRDEAHPFASFGVADVPVDELAALSPEPATLMLMIEGVVEHRLRYRQQGTEPRDWGRSVTQVVGERLVSRLSLIDVELRSAALELAMSGAEEPVSALDHSDAGRALARAGLARHGGDDVLLGPLARMAARPEIQRVLLRRLPDAAWSDASRQALRAALPALPIRPRAVLVTPRLPFSPWPLAEPSFVPLLGPFRDSTHTTFIALVKLFARLAQLDSTEDSRAELEQLRADFVLLGADLATEAAWFHAIDTSLVTLTELEDEDLLRLDFDRGTLRRFDAIDRVWGEEATDRYARAYLRWLGLTQLMARVDGRDALKILHEEAERSLSLIEGLSLEAPSEVPMLRAALLGLGGDLLVLRGELARARDTYDEVVPTSGRGSHRLALRLALRRAFVNLSLDDVAKATESIPELAGTTDDFDDVPTLWDHSARATVDALLGLEAELHRRFSSPPLPELALARARVLTAYTEAAVAVELGDWPRALSLVESEHPPGDQPKSDRARLVWAWTRMGLGELDIAGASFRELLASARRRGDRPLAALALRGTAAVAASQERRSQTISDLEAALAIEQELGLPDARLLEFEILTWRASLGEPVMEDYERAAARLPRGSRSARAAALDAVMRLVAQLPETKGTGTSSPARVEDWLRPLQSAIDPVPALCELSPWFEQARARLSELLAALQSAGATQRTAELRALVHPFGLVDDEPKSP